MVYLCGVKTMSLSPFCVFSTVIIFETFKFVVQNVRPQECEPSVGDEERGATACVYDLFLANTALAF